MRRANWNNPGRQAQRFHVPQGKWPAHRNEIADASLAACRAMEFLNGVDKETA